MDDGSRDRAHTNHNRDTMPNGMNGSFHSSEGAYGKARGGRDATQVSAQSSNLNGINGGGVENAIEQRAGAQSTIPKDVADRIQQLPPEILHITEGFESLPRLLQRLSQVTHNQLTKKILDLAGMQIPASAINGNGAQLSLPGDDSSVDNIKKKVQLLKFAEDTHANWTKALVITQWSRVSEDIGKLVDLKVHVDGQKGHYDWAVHEMSEMKRSLVHARVPNPDLKTAVEVLSTGKASWMPDVRRSLSLEDVANPSQLGYIEPPPLTAQDLLKSLQNLNTLLSIRLNVYEYDRIPLHFKNFTIKSGRVTFRVEGEFEVDLTIADESPDTQFWFIDFRFLFSPVIEELPEHLRYMIESKVNAALEKDGLAGCYKFLHELTLTHKISELRRQALELSRGRWIETLHVEPLRRSLSIQYWVDRYGRDGPKSWIILGIHSGKRKDGIADPKSTSKISIRWFRDSKEVKDADIPLELTNLSAEALMKNVIERHTFHILSKVYAKLRERLLFKNRELSLAFGKSTTEPKEMQLRIQLTRKERIVLTVEPVAGRFAISPPSRTASQMEWRLNTQVKDPASNANELLEHLRCLTTAEEVNGRALSVGWIPIRNSGLKPEDIKHIVPRDTVQLSWFRGWGWNEDWVLAFTASMSGDRFWLIQTADSSPGLAVRSHIQIPIKTALPQPTHAFLSTLHLFASALIVYHTNLRMMHSSTIHYRVMDKPITPASAPISLPAILIKMSDILRPAGLSTRSGKPWARDALKMYFQGLEYVSAESTTSILASSPPGQQEMPMISAPNPPVLTSKDKPQYSRESMEIATVIVEAIMTTPMPKGLNLTKQHVHKDVAFHPSSGAFAFRARIKIGEPAIPAIQERLRRIEQLVDFIAVAQRHSVTLRLENISLDMVVFSYGGNPSEAKDLDTTAVDIQKPAHVATVDLRGKHNDLTLTLDHGNPHIRILDYLTKILNSSQQGLDGVATMMQLTLPLLCALTAIENNWAPLSERGEVLISSRAADWYTIHYRLNASATAGASAEASEPVARRVVLEVRLQNRRKQAWWSISRMHERGTAPGGDAIDLALDKVWNSDSEGDGDWRGMRSSGIAKGEGVGVLLGLIDEAVRDVAVKLPSVAEAPAIPTVPHQPQQSQHPQHPQQTQQRVVQSQNQRRPQTQPPAQNQFLGRQVQQQQQRNQFQHKQQNSSQNGPKHEMIVID
ncbi:MAG: mediator complex subunit [Claussenomyces sp. TS43310]|nr:MAG: mediator complex subunit [Claussenomyces sp. TS43310]